MNNDELRELIDGEESKFYTGNFTCQITPKTTNNEITVDSADFQHSLNDNPAIIFYNGGINIV